MSSKNTKAKPRRSGFRYAPEDLAPRDFAADEALLDSFIKRNTDALNASIQNARAQIMRGKYFTREQVIADIKAQRQRRRTGKK